MCDFGVDIPISPSLIIRDTCKELQKPSVSKTYSVGFNHYAELLYKKINSKDKAFLEKFRVKESSNLIGLEKFWATECSIMAGLERYSLHQSKNDQISTHHSSSPNFYFLHIKALLPLLLLEMGH